MKVLRKQFTDYNQTILGEINWQWGRSPQDINLHNNLSTNSSS